MGIDFRTFMGCIVAPRRGIGLRLENPTEWSLPESHDEQSDVMGHTMFNQTPAYDLSAIHCTPFEYINKIAFCKSTTVSQTSKI